jgi:hypothetical protein
LLYVKNSIKYLFAVVLMFGCIANASGQSIASENFERADILAGTAPVSWTNASPTDAGFTTVTGPFTGKSLTYNKPSSGTFKTMSAILSGSPINFSSLPHEWTLLYQAPTGITQTDNDGPNVSGNNWRFYFNATGDNPSTGAAYNKNFKGYYVTQDGNFLRFYYLCGDCGSRELLGSVAVTAGKKYIIRAIRQTTGGGTYLFYATEYTSSSSFPTTPANSTDGTFDQIKSYKTSFFQSSLSSNSNNGAFKWDDLNFYQASLTLSALNNVGTGTGGNGITAFLTQGDNQKAVFGFKATALGSVTMTQADFSWTSSTGGNSTYFEGAKLYYSSGDDVYTPAADDASIGNVSLDYGAASITNLNQPIANTSRNYFLVVDVKNYALTVAMTANIGLTSVKIAGNSPINIPSNFPVNSFTLPATPTTWTGSKSTAWALAANWNGGVPTSTSSAIIPTGLSRYPVLSGPQSVNTLSLNNASIDLGGYVLSVSNSMLSNNSTISGTGNSYLNITGGADDRTISGTKLTVTNLKINLPSATNTFNVYAPVNVTNLLTVSKGTLSSGGHLTLKSTSAGTANVDAMPSGASVTGNVNVERYVTGGSANSRGYRLISSPVSVSSTSLVSPALNYLNDQTYTSGTGGTANGFTAAGNPSLYLYRENTLPSTSFLSGNYKGVAKINDGANITLDGEANTNTLPAGNGVLFFFRGGPTTVNPTSSVAIAQAATFTTTGYLNQGNITVKHWTKATGLLFTNTIANTSIRGFNLVGNPYASSIDWDTFGTGITGNNISGTIYIYNPVSKTYAVYIKGNKGVGKGFPTGTNANIIPSGQGFFVKATGTNPTLTFTEAAKVATKQVTSNLLLSTAPVATEAEMQYLRVSVIKDSLNKEDALIFFKSNAKPEFVANEDAEYLKGNSIVNISTQSSDKLALAINQTVFPKTGSTVIGLNVNVTTSGIYQLNLAEAKNIPELYDVWLKDAYKNDSLDIKHNPTYNFNVYTTDAASFGQKRFSLVIRANPAYAYRLLDFSATKAATNVTLAWKTENEANATYFTVERSVDGGKNFDILGSTRAVGQGNYSVVDAYPVKGVNQYRLKQEDANGLVTYSKIASVNFAEVSNIVIANTISVYPNPASAVVNVVVDKAPEVGAYSITMVSSTGRLVKTVLASQPNWQGDVSTLLPGTYFVQVINEKDKSFVGRSTFLKL